MLEIRNKYIVHKSFVNSKSFMKMPDTIYKIKKNENDDILEGKRLIETSDGGMNIRDALRNHVTEIYDSGGKKLYLKLVPAFKVIFQKYIITDGSNKRLGTLKQQLFIFFFRRRFKVLDNNGRFLMKVSSDFWLKRYFTFYMKGNPIAIIDRKWRGTKYEALEYDNYYHINVLDKNLDYNTRKLILASALFIDQTWGTKSAT